MFCNFTEISTSAAVTEIRMVYGLIAGAFSLMNLNFIGILFLSLIDAERNSAIEANAVFAFSTA